MASIQTNPLQMASYQSRVQRAAVFTAFQASAGEASRGNVERLAVTADNWSFGGRSALSDDTKKALLRMLTDACARASSENTNKELWNALREPAWKKPAQIILGAALVLAIVCVAVVYISGGRYIAYPSGGFGAIVAYAITYRASLVQAWRKDVAAAVCADLTSGQGASELQRLGFACTAALPAASRCPGCDSTEKQKEGPTVELYEAGAV